MKCVHPSSCACVPNAAHMRLCAPVMFTYVHVSFWKHVRQSEARAQHAVALQLEEDCL